MRLHHRTTPRAGFTLVELLVAMALILVIMAIISTAFSISLETFRQLKAIGDMSEQLRSTSTIIRRDLAADHLQDDAENTPRLSNITPGTAWGGTKKGFFYVRQDPLPVGNNEGVDGDLLPSWRAGGAPTPPGQRGVGYHEFGMTVKLPAKTQSDTFAGGTTTQILLPANLGSSNLIDFASTPGQMVSQWAEVYYFLRETSVRTADANNVSLPLYTLYRRQRVVSPNTVMLQNPAPNQVGHPDILASTALATAQIVSGGPPPTVPQFMAVGPEALTTMLSPTPTTFIPANRLGGWHDPNRWEGTNAYPGYPAPPPPAGPGAAPPTFDWRPYPIPGASGEYGSDVVLNNVVSMRVQLQNNAGQYMDPPTGATPSFIFDTARPGMSQVRGIKIQLRVYHAKSNLTRQVTIIQDL